MTKKIKISISLDQQVYEVAKAKQNVLNVRNFSIFIEHMLKANCDVKQLLKKQIVEHRRIAQSKTDLLNTIIEVEEAGI